MVNRRYFGLAFAVGMGWQLVFILWLTTSHFTYFLQTEVYWGALFTGYVPYLFLLAMTLTSFRRFGRHLSGANWRRLHKTGMYLFWFVITSGYVEIALSGSGDVFGCLVLSLFLWAWLLRMVSFARRRHLRRSALGSA
jgi:hypothetical protein